MASRPGRRWLATLPVLLALAASLGCGDAGGVQSTGARPSAADAPRDDEIRATLDAIWSAVPVPPAEVTIGEYGYDFLPDREKCAELARDDRWYGHRGALLPGRLIGQAELESSIVGFFEGEGFTVERYRSTRADDPTRAFRAVRGELVAWGILGGAGDANVAVESGPCAPLNQVLDPNRYELDR